MTAISLVCPHCQRQVAFEAAEGWSDAACPDCRGNVHFLCAKVRSKKSRADKKAQSRDYSVRLLYADREDLVEFTGPYDEFSMSPGDWMAFGYDRDKHLAVVENITLGRFLNFAKPRDPLRRAAWLAGGAIVLVVAILVAFVLLRH